MKNIRSIEASATSLVSLGKKFDDLHQFYLSQRSLFKNAPLDEKADELLNTLVGEIDDVVNRAIDLTAVTADDLRIKARMALWMSPSHDLAHDTACAEYTDRIVWSIARDLLAPSPGLNVRSSVAKVSVRAA